jgi:Zn-dependent metalloprotease
MIPALGGVALRSMKAPGTAYRGDPQPASMPAYKNLPDDDANDYGGVHTNSGIPNRAFYLAATAIGGLAWEGAGKIWYRALTTKFTPTTNFAQAAQARSTQRPSCTGPAVAR